MDADMLAAIKAAALVLRTASPHGWLPVGSRQPEPAPLRGVVDLSMPVYTPLTRDADVAAALVLSTIDDLLAVLEAKS